MNVYIFTIGPYLYEKQKVVFNTIRRLAKRFKETGSTKNRNVKRRCHVLREETLNEIGERLEHNPQKPLKCLSQETGVSVLSVQRATKLLKLKPYKIPPVHALHQPDPNKILSALTESIVSTHYCCIIK